MLSVLGKTLFRLIGVAILGTLISITGLPEIENKHANNPDWLYDHDNKSADRSHLATIATSSGHCHPGLDCLTAANYFLRPILLPERAWSGKLHLWSTLQGGARWSPQFDKPPPRRES